MAGRAIRSGKVPRAGRRFLEAPIKQWFRPIVWGPGDSYITSNQTALIA